MSWALAWVSLWWFIVWFILTRCRQLWIQTELRSCVLSACLGSFFSSVYLAAPRGFVCPAPASVGHSLRMCFSPKHKHLLPGVFIRPKPSEPQQLPISLSQSCGDDSLALNDVCFQFRQWCSLLWALFSTENGDGSAAGKSRMLSTSIKEG